MDNREKNFVSAVLYVHNSEKHVRETLKALIHVMEENFENSEIICVNDYSSDDSLAGIKEAAKEAVSTSLSVINMSYYHGLELSMNAGVDIAIGDFVFEFDNTYFDFELSTIMDVYHKALGGFDIVSAVPDKKERFSSRLFYKLFNKHSNVVQNMTTERFRILSRRVINRISGMNKTNPYRKALYANCGLRTDILRYKTVSNLGRAFDKKEKEYRYSLAMDSLILFTDLGYQFSKWMSFLMIFMTVAVVVYTIVAFIVSNPVAGWTSTVLFLSVAFFGLFVILTIIIKYLQIIIELVFKRKHYSFESIEKITK